MAPTNHTVKNKEKFKGKGKGGNWQNSKNKPAGVKKKRKWIPENKIFDGSVKEGQGFAFKRKQKFQYEYKKLLRKEKRKNPESVTLYKDEYPEHLRHLYLAEAKKLKNEAWENRVNRSKHRVRGHEEEKAGDRDDDDDDADDDDAAAEQAAGDTGAAEQADSASGKPKATEAKEGESLPMSNRMRKKMMKKTSYQKTKEEFEKIKEKQKKKKEDYLKHKQQREEAIERYKEKKRETFQMLSKKTKKGQPNLNLQMDYLLQKIQGTMK